MQRWLPCQTAVASSAYLGLAASIFDRQMSEALFTAWMAPTVAIDTGAGRLAFTIVPSAATMLTGFSTPSFQVMS